MEIGNSYICLSSKLCLCFFYLNNCRRIITHILFYALLTSIYLIYFILASIPKVLRGKVTLVNIFLGKVLHCVKSVQIQSFLWSVFYCIRTQYGDLLRKPPNSVRIQKNKDQKKLRIWKLFTQCYF